MVDLPDPRSKPPKSILVVEDEAMVGMLLEDMLAELGFTVVGPVARLPEALEAARTADLDAAILDVNLAGSETYPVADALVARGIPIVFATGYGAEGLREGYRDRPILQKPFQQRDLEARIADMGLS